MDTLEGRNGSGKFARRSVKNLDFIVDAALTSADVHPITQTVSALLALIVFPWERRAFAAVKNKRLAITVKDGWPSFTMSGPRADANEIKTIGNLIEQIRHAVAHGHVRFDSDSRVPTEVTITFENRRSRKQPLEWRADIRADQLAAFCRVFSEFIEDYVS